MNKTPMKSFEIIKEMYEYFVKKSRDLEPKLMICEKEDFSNVENAIKRLETLEEEKQSFDRQLEKKLKALEIINDKPQIEIIHIRWRMINSYEDYLKATDKWDIEYCDMILTQEEFDLLKEVLL